MSKAPDNTARCPGAGPLHSKEFTVGDSVENNFVADRVITLHNLRLHKCGCTEYPRLGPLCDLLLAETDRTEATWDDRKNEWR